MEIQGTTSAIQASNAAPVKTVPSAKDDGSLLAYRKDEAVIDYTSRDGDTVHIEYSSEKLLYASSSGDAAAASKKPYLLSPEEASRFRNQLKQELFDYKEALIKSLVESKGGKFQTVNIPGVPAGGDEVADLEALMPEYWSAENTSQRIVDFATSFFSAFEGEASDFFKTIKEAIKEGFGQAKDQLGELPGTVGKLVNKTFDLTMEKLDAYEREVAAQKTAEQQPQEPFSAVA